MQRTSQTNSTPIAEITGGTTLLWSIFHESESAAFLVALAVLLLGAGVGRMFIDASNQKTSWGQMFGRIIFSVFFALGFCLIIWEKYSNRPTIIMGMGILIVLWGPAAIEVAMNKVGNWLMRVVTTVFKDKE